MGILVSWSKGVLSICNVRGGGVKLISYYTVYGEEAAGWESVRLLSGSFPRVWTVNDLGKCVINATIEL